jgi:hypothetical protein
MPESRLRLGKGATFFVKSRLKRLPQEDETWEADFRALPQAITQSATHYLGMVLTQPAGFFLAELEVERKPTVNDLATLLVHAMQRPIVEGSHRPRRIHLRNHPQWQELFPHLKEIGIEVAIKSQLPKVAEAYREYLQDVSEVRPARKVKPSAKAQSVETLFPAIAQWVRDGHIEIGDQEDFGFVVRALDYGGMVFEDNKPRTLAEALVTLEKGLRKWFKEQKIEVESPDRRKE